MLWVRCAANFCVYVGMHDVYVCMHLFTHINVCIYMYMYMYFFMYVRVICMICMNL
jgi:hypothetical protein